MDPSYTDEAPLSKRAKTALHNSRDLFSDPQVCSTDHGSLKSQAQSLLAPPLNVNLAGYAQNVLDHAQFPESRHIKPLEGYPNISEYCDASTSQLQEVATPRNQLPEKCNLLPSKSKQDMSNKKMASSNQDCNERPVTQHSVCKTNSFQRLCEKQIVSVNADRSHAMDFSFFLTHQPQVDASPSLSSPPKSPPRNCESEPMDEPEDQSPGHSQDCHPSPPLYEGSAETAHDCMVSVLCYAQANHLSGAAVCELLKLLEHFLPQPNTLPKSSFLFKKYFNENNNELQLFYFCTNCWKSRSSFNDICVDCTAPNRKVSYFISCPLQPQLQRLFNRPGFCNMLKYKLSRKKENEANIEDIYDGKLYKEAEREFLSNQNNISLTWYSDGISIYECSVYSLWPCMYIINELPPQDRHKPQNILMGGLWGGDGKPHPNMFLLPMYQEIVKLKDGVQVTPYGSDEKITVRGILIFGTCDLPAKAGFMNMKGHAGYYSCAKCFVKGEKSDRTDKVMVFPHEDVLELRNDDNYYECVLQGIHDKDGHKGIFGPTLLSYMFYGSFISGMTIDSMHGIFMGNLKQLMKLWFDVKYKAQPFSMIEKIPIVNDRLRAIGLPHFVQRMPIDVDKPLCYVKASLARNYFFYIFKLVLRDLLLDPYYDNFCNLVDGVALLNNSSISESDLQLADNLLFLFCKDFQQLYGIRHMTLNIHCLRHLVQCVIDSGNLFYLSCFRFEDLNGKLCALVHGTKYAISQIGSQLSLLTDLPCLIESVKLDSIKNFCKSLTRMSKNISITEKICDGTYVAGNLTHISLYSSTIRELVTVMYGKPCDFSCFYRLYKNGQLYVSCSYTQGSRVSSYCKYSCCNELHRGNILTFVKTYVADKTKFLALIQRSADVPNSLRRCFEYSPTEDVDLISVTQLKCVCFCLSVDGHKFLIDPLNTFEME